MHAAYAQLFVDDSDEVGTRVLFLDRGIAFCRHEDGIMALRMFAAMERVFYEQIIERRTQGRVVSEQLLFPVQVDLGATELAMIEEHADFLASFGYDLSVQGTAATIQGVPWFVQAGQEEDAMTDALECLGVVSTAGVGAQEELMIVQLAKKRAYSARGNVSIQHVQKLVQDLRKCTISHISPSGMATYTIVTTDEIEKRLQ
jgi:DNA mismatch repair protein MutL